MSTPADHPDHARLAAYEEQGRGRRRRIKKLLKYLPRRSNVVNFPGLKRIGAKAKALPYLWSYRGSPLIRAFYIGSVVTLLPLVGAQLLVGGLGAIILRCNLPVVVALGFVTNPLTSAPIYYGTYQLGRWILNGLGMHHWGTGTAMVPALAVGGVLAGLLLGGAIHLMTILWVRWYERHKTEVQELRDRLRRK